MLKPWANCACLVLCCGILMACAGTHPVNHYQDLASVSKLTSNDGDDSGHIPFRYSAGNSWSGFTGVVLDPVAIYVGADHQFGDTSEADRTTLAAYMQTQFADALQARYALSPAPGPGVLRVHLTLAGIQTSTPVMSTLSKVAPIGLVVNSVQSVRDKQASFTGSVSYAVEIYDGGSNELLLAYIAKQYPLAENIATSFGPLDASRAGVRAGARALLAQLR